MGRATMLIAGAVLAMATIGAAPDSAAQDPAAPDNRPRIITKAQFECLLRHASNLEVSAGGTVIDIAECPPKLRLGFFPRKFEERYLVLTPADLKCLEKARRPGHGIAWRRPGEKVALYLRPCGK